MQWIIFKINISISNWFLHWFILVDSKDIVPGEFIFFVKMCNKKQRGWAGPLGFEAEGCKKLFASSQFWDSPAILYNTEYRSLPLELFFACCLISLDTNSGLRPIGLVKCYDKFIIRRGVKTLTPPPYPHFGQPPSHFWKIEEIISKKYLLIL